MRNTYLSFVSVFSVVNFRLALSLLRRDCNRPCSIAIAAGQHSPGSRLPAPVTRRRGELAVAQAAALRGPLADANRQPLPLIRRDLLARLLLLLDLHQLLAGAGAA